MNFPEKYIQRAKPGEPFTLHSGDKSDTLYDINSMLMDDAWLREILNYIPHSPHYLGIPTGGALIAREASRVNHTLCSIIKDGEIKGQIPKGAFLLVDDVVTTGKSLEDALNTLRWCDVDVTKGRIYVVVDRRPLHRRQLKIMSMFDVLNSS